MKNLYIDYSHLCYRALFVLSSDIQEVGYNILRHFLLKNILSSIDKFSPTKCYIACDSKKNWRKKYFPDYKAQRKEAKEKREEVDWEKFYETINECSNSFKVAFPFYVITQDYLEADDIIASLIRNNKNNEEHIVITSDGDYKQLLQYSNTKIYCPIKKSFMVSDNPFYDLEIKIVMGDKGDNIPAISKRIGIETATKLVDGEIAYKDQTLSQMMENSEIKANYERNKKLIDLTKTPKELIGRLDKELMEYKLASSAGIFQYFIDHKLRDLLSNIEEISKSLAPLNPGYKKPEKKSSGGVFEELSL